MRLKRLYLASAVLGSMLLGGIGCSHDHHDRDYRGESRSREDVYVHDDDGPHGRHDVH